VDGRASLHRGRGAGGRNPNQDTLDRPDLAKVAGGRDPNQGTLSDRPDRNG
jgi:hypothetical protein